MKKLLFLLIIPLILLTSCFNRSAEKDIANIEYLCPICDEVGLFYCDDCGHDFIWCKNSTYIASLICENCGLIDYPINYSCWNCDKAIRLQPRFWINRSGKNHPDCSSGN
jgi:hypothetical protein